MFSEELNIPFNEKLKFLLKRIQGLDSSDTNLNVIFTLSSIYEMLDMLNENKADKTPSLHPEDILVREDVTQQIGRNCTLSAPGHTIILDQTWQAIVYQKNREIEMLREELRKFQNRENDMLTDHTLKHRHRDKK
jgi:hypothetical protein